MNPWLVVAAAALAVSCAPVERKARRFQTECILGANSDQLQTLLARWSRTPVKIALEQGAFTAQEITQIRAGAETWNSFFAASMGAPGLDYLEEGAVRVSATPYQNLTCNPSDSAIQNNVFVRSITLYRRNQWPDGLQNIIAATYSCPVVNRPMNTFIDATIALNFRDFWGAGRPIPDLQTIVTHELGHLLGLKHSCEDGGENGMPNCTNAPPTYRLAVMRPQFGFDAFQGQQVRQLNENDEGRMNCLYKVVSTR
jgi:hypothetical protein